MRPGPAPRHRCLQGPRDPPPTTTPRGCEGLGDHHGHDRMVPHESPYDEVKEDLEGGGQVKAGSSGAHTTVRGRSHQEREAA